MSNVPSGLLWYTPESVRYLRRRCLVIIARKRVKQAHLAASADWSDGDFSHWVHGTRKMNLNEERYWPLLRVVIEEGGIDEEAYDRAFGGISDFLGHPAEVTFERVADFVGNYVVYRYSYLAPGYVLKGSLTITADAKRRALRTREHYRIQSEMLTRILTQPEKSKMAQEQSKVQDLDFPRDGYFFPRSPDSFVMISKKTKKREHEPVEIQTIYFDNVYESIREPDYMRGVVTDWHGDRFYSTRVAVQKLEEPLPLDQIATLDPLDVNDIVNSYLVDPSAEKGFVVSYP
ncbi:MAG: hypothetical protein WA268_13085 [Xanthobacteraceae bacterium]